MQRLESKYGPASEKASQLIPKERTQRLNAALDTMADGLNQVQLDEMTAAMTEEYIEAWDESECSILA